MSKTHDGKKVTGSEEHVLDFRNTICHGVYFNLPAHVGLYNSQMSSEKPMSRKLCRYQYIVCVREPFTGEGYGKHCEQR